MAGETVITIIGNLTADPELKFLASGAGVANFTVASTPRTFDRESNQWKDGETLFMRCAAWREMAENVAESLQRGMKVIVVGRLKQRSYETSEGEKRTVVEMDVDEIGPSLRSATAVVRKVERTQGQQPAQGQYQGQGAGDPWAQAAAQGQASAQTGQQYRQQQAPPQQAPPQQGGGWGAPPQQPPQQGGWGAPPQGPPPYDPSEPPF